MKTKLPWRAVTLCVGGCLLLYSPSSLHAQTSVTVTNGTNQVRNPEVKFDGTGHKLWVGNTEITAAAQTNARTPLAHAASHASAGSDPLTLAMAQITGLVDALAGKEPTINTGTISQYWRGDKTWQALPTFPANTTATASQFFTAYNSTTGAFTKAPPAFSDLSGSATDEQIPSNITRDEEWNTIGEIEAATGGNIILATEIDTTDELAAFLTDAPSGTGVFARVTGPTFASPILTTATITITGGNQAAPSLKFGTDTIGFYRNALNQITMSSGGNTNEFSFIAGQTRFRSNYLLTWSSSADSTAAHDVGFGRNAAGVFEINSGTAGIFRDLKARNINLSLPTNNAGDVITTDAAQTLTNKSIDGGQLTGTIGAGNLPSTATLDTEWDTLAEIETSTGTNIIQSTEIDTAAEFNTSIGDADFSTTSHNHTGVYQPADADLDTWATKTAPSGTVVGTTDTQSLTNKKLGSLTTNGFVKTGSGDGTLSVDTNAYQTGHKETQTLGIAAATITFTVPAGYTNLRIICSGRIDLAAVGGSIKLRFNGDTGGNYQEQFITGSNSDAPTALHDVSEATITVGTVPGTTTAANYAGVTVIFVPNYLGGFYKEVTAHGSTYIGTQQVRLYGGTWKNTAAITSVTLSASSSANFVAGFTATLIAE